MLGMAASPGLATITTWWRSLNGFLGRCRPQIPLHTCVATIQSRDGQAVAARRGHVLHGDRRSGTNAPA